MKITDSCKQCKKFKQQILRVTNSRNFSAKWTSSITINGKKKSLGYFKNEIEAAKAYDEAAKKYFSEFARYNFIEN